MTVVNPPEALLALLARAPMAERKRMRPPLETLLDLIDPQTHTPASPSSVEAA